MNKKVFKTLEFDKIIDRLCAHADSEDGKKLCHSLRPMTDLEKIESAQQQTADAFARIVRCGRMSFGGTKDLSSSMKRLEAGASLSAAELLQVRGVLLLAGRAVAYGKDQHGDNIWDSLSGYFTSLDPVKALSDEIGRCILSEDEIADDASPALRKIRGEIGQMGERIRGQMNALLNRSSMQNILQDHVITMRGDHYCLPIRAEYRSQVPGIVLDQSSTGSTLFIEPASVVQLGNHLTELTLQEQEEIEKILAKLSEMASGYIGTLLADQKSLVYLDFVFAKAALASDMRATRPHFNQEHRINLKQARHPLLDPKKVVPINLPLGTDYDQLIVTGPNTGGKTVSLKTTGLLTLMGQAGLHIPAGEQSELSIFQEVYADIGDEQSIEQNLSTFSSHMTNIVFILQRADRNTLVLFDELCAGTDPAEGAALAVSILARLHQRKVTTMATTHYSELKVYALSTDGVENASCEFDVETLSPTYRLLIGIPGKSNAFAISQKLGLDKDIIQDAKARLSEEDLRFEDMVADLQARQKKLEDMEAQTQLLNRRAREMSGKLQEKLDKNTSDRDKILNQAREEAAQILQAAKKQADESIRYINKYGSSPDAVKKLEKERTKLRNKIDRNSSAVKKEKKAIAASVKHPDPKKLKIGDSVKVLSLNVMGTVHTLPDKRGNLVVRMGIMTSRVNINDLEMVKEKEPSYGTGKKSSSYRSGGSSVRMAKSYSVSPEIVLIGKNSDDAIAELDKYLDDAYLANLSSVRIVHGKGSGVLRKAVQQHLKSLPYIKSFHNGEYGEGDSGVTIAEFDQDK